MPSPGNIKYSLMPVRFLIALCCIWLAAIAPACAQKITAQLSKSRVQTGEAFTLSFEVEGAQADWSDLQAPSLKDFEQTGGQGISRSFNMINGVMTYSTTFSYPLRARQPGEYVIGSATLRNGRRLLQSTPIKITVTGTASPAPQAGAVPPGSGDKDIFLRVEVDNPHPYVGQAVFASYKLYMRQVQLTGHTLSRMPRYEGFWVEAMRAADPDEKYEELNGQRYLTAVIKKDLLYPQKAGALIVDEATLEVEGFRGGDPIGGFDDPLSGSFPGLGGGFAMEPFNLNLTSKPLKLEVKPLPADGKPADFSGLVGEVLLSARVDAETVKAHEPLDLQVTVAGNGSLNLMQAFKLNLGPDVEVYDPKSTLALDRSGASASGTRTFSYTVIPHKEGRLEIPALHLTYFNPSSGKYEQANTRTFSIQVTPGDPAKAENYARQKAEERGSGWGMIPTIAKYLLYAAFIIFMLIVGYSRMRKPKAKAGQESGDMPESPILNIDEPEIPTPIKTEVKPEPLSFKAESEPAKAPTAPPVAPVIPKPVIPAPSAHTYRRRLQEAAIIVNQSESTHFFQAVHEAVIQWGQSAGYTTATSTPTLRTALTSRGLSNWQVQRFSELMSACEMARYAPGAAQTMDKHSLLAQAEELLGS